MTNRYGVDVDYFEKWIKRSLSDLSNYKPDELARELARMARTADSEVLREPEFSIEPDLIASLRYCKHLASYSIGESEALSFQMDKIRDFIDKTIENRE
jgi:hypothetical protein